MKKFIDLTGMKFGRLTVIKRVENNKWGNHQYLCKCECGNEKIIRSGNLKSGDIKSCGCLAKEKASKNFKKYNTYDLSNEYGIGYTSKGEEFYFDLEDYNKIKNYCWYKNIDGYLISHLDKNNLLWMHRLVMNCPDDMEVDHEFHDKWDNRKEFLRIVTVSQNGMNQKIPKNNTSGTKGVSWYERDQKWQAYIQINKKKTGLGRFNNIEDAIKARKEAELKYYKEYNYKEKNN